MWCEDCGIDHDDEEDEPEEESDLSLEEARLILQPQLRDAVKRGYCLLSEKRPDWLSMITLDTLDLASSSACVLGQVYYGYSTGVDRLGIDGAQYGFDIPDDCEGINRSDVYRMLDEIWHEAIVDW